jgi:D-glycero-D-manno-heptose 1,7-bisphosphate phosphatase
MKLAILERDGIVGQPVLGQLAGHADWQSMPDAAISIARLNLSGWHVVLVANQPGLGRGLYDCAALNDYHRQMYKELATVGAKVDAVFFCPHPPDDHCDCLDAQAALLRQILDRFNMEAGKVAVIARSPGLLQAAASLGARLHWVSVPGGPDAEAALCPSQEAQQHASMVQCTEQLLQTMANRPPQG